MNCLCSLFNDMMIALWGEVHFLVKSFLPILYLRQLGANNISDGLHSSEFLEKKKKREPAVIKLYVREEKQILNY